MRELTLDDARTLLAVAPVIILALGVQVRFTGQTHRAVRNLAEIAIVGYSVILIVSFSALFYPSLLYKFSGGIFACGIVSTVAAIIAIVAAAAQRRQRDEDPN